MQNKSCDLKICDLGLARGYEDEDEEKTEYVVTRWYRAPEVILNASEYSKAVDIWSVGCILAELLGRTPLFPGEDFLDQVQRIISVLGTPSQEDQKYIGNENALKYIKNLPKRTRQAWDKLFPNFKPATYDLLNRMLTFNPDKRYTVDECLGSPRVIQRIPTSMGCTHPTKSPQPNGLSTGLGITSNRRRSCFRRWCTRKVCTSIPTSHQARPQGRKNTHISPSITTDLMVLAAHRHRI
jgi:serine/threonine protein kinase